MKLTLFQFSPSSLGCPDTAEHQAGKDGAEPGSDIHFFPWVRKEGKAWERMKSSLERVGQRDPGARFSPKCYSFFRRYLTKQRVFFTHGEQDYINLGKLVYIGFLRVKFHWWRLKVLGTPRLHGEAFQKGEPVVSPRFMGIPQVVLGQAPQIR